MNNDAIAGLVDNSVKTVDKYVEKLSIAANLVCMYNE
jgi:hypothetical protein